MNRVDIAASLLGRLDGLEFVLDVGCRDGTLRTHLPKDVAYYGADLFPNGEHVKYVGDFGETRFDRRFTAVTALDVLEHMEHPSLAFDKLVSLSTRYVIASFPNCYDLKTRVRFALSGRMGGKYEFLADEPQDRHRWLMGYGEITDFFHQKAERLNLQLEIIPLQYGFSGLNTARSRLGAIISKLAGPSLSSETVIGLFKKPDA